MRVIHDTEFPNSVEATQKLLDEQGTEYERLKVMISDQAVFSIRFLSCIETVTLNYVFLFCEYRRRF